MPHPRKQIRDALLARLTGLATTGNHVFPDPVYDLEQAALPALMLNTGDEQIEEVAYIGGRTLERKLAMEIAVLARGENRSDVLDQAASEIEAAIAADVTLGGACQDARLAAIRREDAAGDAPLARLALEYEITYTTEA